ncbi:hypothetical protein Angca_001659 [Angiostrongylus cantonensis]|nr:hypothetical protein Angca_001659 [Angiostrongylus cantonensis]
MSQIRQPSIADLVVYLSSCTEEDRQLFEKECSILLECRACKSIFRSFMNFCSHKRTFCRAEAHEILNTNAGNSGDYTSPKKVAGLRRTNLTKHVSRKADVSEIQVCAEDNQVSAFVHTLPSSRRNVVAIVGPDGLTRIHIPPSDNIAEKLPPDRVLLLQPQAYPSRYRGMSLRMRLKGDNTRVISKEEVECVERLLTYFHDDVEPALGRCLYSSCSDISPFGSVWALAYHMSVKHSQKEESTNAIPCLMCSKKFTTWGFFCSHLNRKHKQIKLDHLSQRRKEADEVINKKKAKKVRTIPRSTNGVIRCRSLSPEVDRVVGDQQKLHPVDTQEVGNLNLSVESKDSDEKLDVNLNPIPTDSVECCNIRTSNDGTSSGERVPRQLKCRRIRHSLIRLEGDGQQQSMTNSRERRKRKIPARYRDDDTSSVKDEMLVKTKDCSGSTCVSQDTSSLAPMACENSILEDVTAVMRLLVCTVVETYQENISDTLVTNVRSRSSRLRKRPDWMDNEDFFIVDDRKYRRDGPNETSISPVFNQGDSMSSNSLPSKIEPSSASHCSSSDLTSRNQNVSTHTRRSTPNTMDLSGTPSRRRKQNLNALSDDAEDSVTIVSKNGRPGKVNDLAMVPVYLSGAQKHLFFSSLKQLDPNEPDGKHVCSQCNEVVPNLKEGRRHMVTHIRVMRLRCSLCGAGSFFCTDLRVHLMEGYCEKLHRAPEGVVNSNRNPCMTKEQADSLSELVDPVNPGRVMYTSGKIVSAKSRISYYPDPVIEERILGPGRIFHRASPIRLKSGRV